MKLTLAEEAKAVLSLGQSQIREVDTMGLKFKLGKSSKCHHFEC